MSPRLRLDKVLRSMTVQRELERCRKRWKKAPAEVDRASMQLLDANGPMGGDEFNDIYR